MKKKDNALIRAEELAMTIDEPVGGFNKFSEWLQKFIDGEKIVFPSLFKDSKPTVVRATRNGRSVCFEDGGYLAMFASRCYSMGETSVYTNIKAAYERGEVRTAEDVLESVQESIKKFPVVLTLQGKIRHAINVEFGKTLPPEKFPSVSETEKEKMRKFILKGWRQLSDKKEKVETALKEILRSRKAESKARTYSEADYH